MSKYDALWAYIQGRNEERLVLSFADIAQIAGTPLEQRPDQRGICRFYLGASAALVRASGNVPHRKRSSHRSPTVLCIAYAW